MPLTPAPTARWSDLRLVAAGALLTIGIFVADLQFPLGYSISALYGIIVLLGLFVRWRPYAYAAAAAATVFTVADALLSPEGGHATMGYINRSLTLTGVWVSAYLSAATCRSAARWTDR